MSQNDFNLTDMFGATSLGSPDKAVGFMLWRVTHRYQRAIDRSLADAGLTHLQFTTLAMAAWLAKDGQAPTQPALADASGIQPMQLSQTLKALEAKLLIERSQNPEDGRSKVVVPTQTGVDALKLALPQVIGVQNEFFGASVTDLLDRLQAIEALNGQ